MYRERKRDRERDRERYYSRLRRSRPRVVGLSNCVKPRHRSPESRCGRRNVLATGATHVQNTCMHIHVYMTTNTTDVPYIQLY